MALRNISTVYDFMVFIVRKERNVFLTIQEAMNALDNGQLDAMSYWASIYGEDGVVHDAIAEFKRTSWFTTDTVGFFPLPSDYCRLLGFYTVAGSTTYKPTYVNEDELADALNSQLRPVATTTPKWRDDNGGIQLYPQVIQYGTLMYLRRPAIPVYAYTESGRTITYDSANSVQLEWNELYWNNIIARALVYVGINMNENTVTQFAAAYNQETKEP